MTTRAERLQVWRDKHPIRAYKTDSERPNPPCGRCGRTLEALTCHGSHITEHTVPYPREEYIGLCPRCYTDLIAWLDLEPEWWLQ